MLNKLFSRISHPKCMLFFFCILLRCVFLESSIINPDLAPELPGYEDFVSGRRCFDEKNWDESIDFFAKAIKKSRKPSLRCSNYLTIDGYGSVCDEFDEDEDGFVIRNPLYHSSRKTHSFMGGFYGLNDKFLGLEIYFWRHYGVIMASLWRHSASRIR